MFRLYLHAPTRLSSWLCWNSFKKTSAIHILWVCVLSLSHFHRSHKTIVVLWTPSELIWLNVAQDNLKKMNTPLIYIPYESHFQCTEQHMSANRRENNDNNNDNIPNKNKIRLRNKSEVGLSLPSLACHRSLSSSLETRARLNLSLQLWFALVWANYHYPWLACTFWLFIKLCVV